MYAHYLSYATLVTSKPLLGTKFGQLNWRGIFDEFMEENEAVRI